MSLMRWLDKTKHRLMLLLFVFSIGLYYLLFWCRFNISLQRKEQIPNIDNFKVKDNRNVNLQLKNDMEAYIQDKIKQIQNPTSCELSSKVVCELPPAGFGSQVHLLTICFTIGFMTKRVVIFKKGRSKYNKTGWDELFLPLSSTCSTHMNSTVHQVLNLSNTEDIQAIQAIFAGFYINLENVFPENMNKIIERFHSDPQLWWAGQMASYILRPTVYLRNLIADKKKALGFKNVIVGLQVRRTDKHSEADYHELSQYMEAAETWFNDYERKHGAFGVKRRIFLATDEPRVVVEAKRKFPDYTFINDINISTAANKRGTRYMYSSLVGIVLDTFMLSMCDYLVCTMTSNICRLAFELMQPRYTDASANAKSLDCAYFIHRLYKRNCKFKLKSSRGLF